MKFILQKHIQNLPNLVKYLRWSFYKMINGFLTIFAKAPSKIFD